MVNDEQLTRRDLVAWAAGFIDGEGSIMLVRDRRHVRLRLSVGQTRLEPLLRLKALFGGSIYCHHRHSDVQADTYHWDVRSDKAVWAALQELEPYLVNKAANVELARRFIALGHHAGGARRREPEKRGWAFVDGAFRLSGTLPAVEPTGPPQSVLDERAVLAEAMAHLNRRGPRDEA